MTKIEAGIGVPDAEFLKQPETSFQKRLKVRDAKAGIMPPDHLSTSLDRAAQLGKLEAMIPQQGLGRIEGPRGSSIWVIEAYDNPTESHYDLASVAILKHLERAVWERQIDPRKVTLLEGTSGSAGRSIGYFAGRMGYQVDMLVPQELPVERTRDMEALGVNVIKTEKAGGVGQVVKEYKRRLVQLRKEGYTELPPYEIEGKPIRFFEKDGQVVCAPNHSEIPITPRAFRKLATDAIEKLPEGVRIDMFIGTLGNGATIKGISEVLREQFGEVAIVGTETKDAPTNAIRKLRNMFPGDEERVAIEFRRIHGYEMPSPNKQTYHDSFGASTEGYEPPFVEVDKIDHIHLLASQGPWRALRDKYNEASLARGDALDTIGNTSAENLWAAWEYMNRDPAGDKNYLVVFYDKRDQYAA